MKYNNVCIESIGYTVPGESWTSDEIEQKLLPLYERLRLPAGRLELMTGIQSRRFFPADIMPSDISVISCNNALDAADFDRSQIGTLIHGSVCRDFLEPATSCSVHHRLRLSDHCVVYDTSNACLGIVNGMIQAANMIELGQISSALIVGTENGRQLVENTIETLNADFSMTRKQIKFVVASLTIGSASAAVLLAHRELSKTGNRLLGATAVANTVFHDLCHSGQDEAGDNMRPLMTTDSERLMNEGIKTGMDNFERFLDELDWNREQIDRTFCHQVGGTHRKLMLESLDLPIENDFATFPWLGNTGSAALPVTLALGVQNKTFPTPENVALLGIGSGINCLMAGVTWQKSLIGGKVFEADRTVAEFDIDQQMGMVP